MSETAIHTRLMVVVLAIPAWVMAQSGGAGDVGLLAPPPSVYVDASDPTVVQPEQGNTGGVNLDFSFRYLTDYVYRGIDFNEIGGKEDAANAQFEAALSLNLGKAPHPYIGVFANIYNEDPVSRFQEIRPYFGAVWTIRPLELEAGHHTYQFPEREEVNTSEFFVRIELDDSYFFKTERPIFSPYIYGAYDYDQYKGWYFEAGISHTIVIPDTAFDITAYADVAFVTGNQLYATEAEGDDSGFQHYDVGMTIRYCLNGPNPGPARYGLWWVEGYLTYTDGIADDLRADTQLWGGLGLHLRY